MISKFTIIGVIIGSIISILGAASMFDSFANPNEIQETNETFGIGDADKIRFNAPENSFQTLLRTAFSFGNLFQNLFHPSFSIGNLVQNLFHPSFSRANLIQNLLHTMFSSKT